MREQMEALPLPDWFTIQWQVGGPSQTIRRTLAVPDETVGAVMKRALEEASSMGYLTAEDAFSQSALENWSATLVNSQGRELPLELSMPLGAYIDPAHTSQAQLLFRRNQENYHLRAAPLRLSLDGIQAAPATMRAKPAKGGSLTTSLLLLVLIALFVAAILLLVFQKGKKGEGPSDGTQKSAVVDAGNQASTRTEPPTQDAGTNALVPEVPATDKDSDSDDDDDDDAKDGKKGSDSDDDGDSDDSDDSDDDDSDDADGDSDDDDDKPAVRKRRRRKVRRKPRVKRKKRSKVRRRRRRRRKRRSKKRKSRRKPTKTR